MNEYEAVIGLEVHVELSTARKIFCFCEIRENPEPNEQTCEVCTSLPGTLPVMNRDVVTSAVKAGLAVNGQINHFSRMDRKNYFYPDLPKAYQISQSQMPIVTGGHVDIETKDGARRIELTRIHLEEDAGKLIHLEGQGTLVDCNRCGVPLIEIVSEPDLRSADEAVQFLKKLRAILIYTGVTRARMQEGEMRCDVNVSVRKKGDATLGTRSEMKNLNSFAFVAKAIESEFKRQTELLEAGAEIIQETRRFDDKTGQSYAMRTKEDADDYRYFPDPDLVPIHLTAKEIDALAREIPELPDARKARYIKDYGISAYDAERLTEEMAIADYFERAAEHTGSAKTVANLLISDLPNLQKDRPLPDPLKLAAVADLQANGQINSSTTKKVLIALLESDIDPVAYVQAENLLQINDVDALRPYVDKVLTARANVADDYRSGKTKAMQSLIGMVMRETAGRANPVLIQALLEARLAEPDDKA
ncbi:MAG TPA: Asp-tRNA(Asn)/Glu-tRNA(Gln) amidotransferase subunit GatB [Clostridiaceae bacterium]|nr:Asp-tRNA(Asn)/Glu-tRNA(Gln) amidotransferase subunit GatB [Clostridiaceae bacterium]